ncbi:MAG TPA: hypothetical protein QGF58_02840 [Myxococcota bacterium]|nr:hypothetical protein [Myxococcota bacterium]
MLLLIACTKTPEPGDSSADLPDPVGDPDTVELLGMCPLADHLGGFIVEVAPDTSIVDGRVRDGVVPITVLTEVTRLDECALLRRENPYCDPDCEIDEACDLDETCIPYPSDVDLGTVTLAGLEEDLRMEPVTPGFRYFDTSLSHPALAGGELLELHAYGALDEVVLHGVGPTPLVAELEEDLVVVEGSALSLSWEGDPGGRSSLALQLSIDQHGSSPLRIVCELEDDGAGEVPVELVEALLGGGVTGYPNATLTRHTADLAEIDGGCVDLEVSSPLPVGVRVEGYIPCTDEDDCPPTMDCNTEIELCQ